jgi:hypothetical protein
VIRGRYIDIMFEYHRKSFWCIGILSLCFLFPGYAFAHMTGAFDGFLFLSPMVIPLGNIAKFFILILLKPHKDIKQFCKTLLFVAIVELFLAFSCFAIINFAKDGFSHSDIEGNNSELKETYWVIAVIIFYGLLSILPTFSLVKEENQPLKEVAASPRKFLFATMLAFTTPVVLIYMFTAGN